VSDTAAPSAAPEPDAASTRPRSRWTVAEGALLGLLVLPIAVAFVRALVQHWIPVGENATMAIRARDVLTAHHPWLGTWSSASVTSASSVNHPGPLLFDLLALPVRAFGDGAGVAFGIAALNVVAIVVAVLAARDAGGRGLAIWVGFGAAGLSWTLGSSLLIDPWNPHAVLLAFYAFLVCAAAVASGRLRWAPWAIAFGSLSVQTHVSYVALVPAVLVTAGGLAWWRRRSARGLADADAAADVDPEPPPRVRRQLLVALVVGLVLWAQPLWQQIAGPGPGNLSALARAGSGGQERVGLGVAARLVARVVALPPWWSRPSFTDGLVDLRVRAADGTPVVLPGWVPGAAPTLGSIALVVALLVAAAVIGHRRYRADASSLAIVTLVALAAAWWSAASVPAAGYGVAPHQLRWLWPIAVIWMVAVGHAVTSSWGRGPTPVGAMVGPGSVVRAVFIGVVLATLVLVVADLPASEQRVGVARAPGSIASVRSVTRQVAAATLPPVVVDGSGLWIGEPYTIPILGVLFQHDGRGFVLPDEAGQFGTERRVIPAVGARLFLRWGVGAIECAGDGQRIALVSPLDAAGRQAVRARADAAVSVARAVVGSLDDGRLAALPELADVSAADVALAAAVLDGRFSAAVAAGTFDDVLDAESRAALTAFDQDRANVGVDTVAVFVGTRNDAGSVVGAAPDASTVRAGDPAVSCPAT
jgi:hypothetical protein